MPRKQGLTGVFGIGGYGTGYNTDVTGHQVIDSKDDDRPHSLWDWALGTNSGHGVDAMLGRGDFAGTPWGQDPTLMDWITRAQKSEKEVYNSVASLGPAKTHGYMKNLNTGDIIRFQFNPETFEYDRAVNYTDYIAPQMAYPHTVFTSGATREFEFELFMYDRLIEPCGIIKDYMCRFGAFLTPEENVVDWQKPPEMLFCYGYFIRKCVMTHFNIKIDQMDENGTPVMAHFTFGLRQIGVV